jgi:microcystin-dependent protein
MALAGTGSGLTARVMGTTIGAENSTLITGNLPAYTPSGSISAATGTAASTQLFYGNYNGVNGDGAISPGTTSSKVTVNSNLSIGGQTFTGNAQGGTSTAFTNMQPTTFLNAMVKL